MLPLYEVTKGHQDEQRSCIYVIWSLWSMWRQKLVWFFLSEAKGRRTRNIAGASNVVGASGEGEVV